MNSEFMAISRPRSIAVVRFSGIGKGDGARVKWLLAV